MLLEVRSGDSDEVLIVRHGHGIHKGKNISQLLLLMNDYGHLPKMTCKKSINIVLFLSLSVHCNAIWSGNTSNLPALPYICLCQGNVNLCSMQATHQSLVKGGGSDPSLPQQNFLQSQTTLSNESSGVKCLWFWQWRLSEVGLCR